MIGFKARESSLKHAIAAAIAAVIIAGTPTPVWTVPGRTDNGTVTGRQGEFVNRPGCWTEHGYDSEIPCAVVRGGPGL